MSLYGAIGHFADSKPGTRPQATQRDRSFPTTWPADTDRFNNRAAAGKSLGEAIQAQLGSPRSGRCLVFGLPKGGVPIACEVAAVLDAELDVLVPHKVTPPWRRDLTVGAIVDDGQPLFDWDALARANVRTSSLGPAVSQSRHEVRRRRRHYRGVRPIPSVAHRTVVITDDGMTPSLVARAAVRTVRAGNPGSLIFAAPVYPAESADWIRTEADQVLHLHSPRAFHALGLWYRDLAPITDDEVAQLLAVSWDRGH